MANKYAQVYSANGSLNAEMIRIYLESGGLSPLVYQESAGLTYGLTVGPLAQAKIYVPEDQVQAAKQMLDAMENGEVKLEPLDDGEGFESS